MTYSLKIELLSDACFSGGVGFAGEVDIDIEQDQFLGLPWIRGRTLKGLIVEECARILDSFKKIGVPGEWGQSACNLFGRPGESEHQSLKIGNAMLPELFRHAVLKDIHESRISARDMLHSLTDIRYQTKINRETKAHEPHSLRATRLAIKGLSLYSRLDGVMRLNSDDKALFAASVLALRRGGLHRNRGWGRVRCRILNSRYQDLTAQWMSPLLNWYRRRPTHD